MLHLSAHSSATWETYCGVTSRTRKVRLTAIRSFFRYAAYQEPAQSELIQRVLAIPSKRQNRPLVCFLMLLENQRAPPFGARSVYLERAPLRCLAAAGSADRLTPL